ncbi:hypothetical protein SBADM41S_00271 [Streptomyces badius]
MQTVLVDGETAGNIVAWWEEDRRFLGYWFGRPYWGRGIGTEALTAFLERETARRLYARPRLGLRRLPTPAGEVRVHGDRHRCGTGRTSTWSWCSAGVRDRPPGRMSAAGTRDRPRRPCGCYGCRSGLAIQMLLSYVR